MLVPVCDRKTVSDCDGKSIRELCRGCDRNPDLKKKVSPYALSLLQVCLLQEAGFRFENDSFDLGFWLDLAFVKRRIGAVSGEQ